MAYWYLGGGNLGVGDKIVDLLDRTGALTAQARARYASGGAPSAAGPSGAMAQIDPEATRRAANERTSRQSAEIAAREQAAMQMAKLREDARQFDASQLSASARERAARELAMQQAALQQSNLDRQFSETQRMNEAGLRNQSADNERSDAALYAQMKRDKERAEADAAEKSKREKEHERGVNVAASEKRISMLDRKINDVQGMMQAAPESATKFAEELKRLRQERGAEEATLRSFLSPAIPAGTFGPEATPAEPQAAAPVEAAPAEPTAEDAYAAALAQRAQEQATIREEAAYAKKREAVIKTASRQIAKGASALEHGLAVDLAVERGDLRPEDADEVKRLHPTRNQADTVISLTRSMPPAEAVMQLNAAMQDIMQDDGQSTLKRDREQGLTDHARLIADMQRKGINPQELVELLRQEAMLRSAEQDKSNTRPEGWDAGQRTLQRADERLQRQPLLQRLADPTARLQLQSTYLKDSALDLPQLEAEARQRAALAGAR